MLTATCILLFVLFIFVILFGYGAFKISGDISEQEDVLLKEIEDEKNNL